MISVAEIQPDALIPCGEFCEIQMENGFRMGASLVKQSRIPSRIRPWFLKRVQNPRPLSDSTPPHDDRREAPKEAPNENEQAAHSLWELLDKVTGNDDRVRRLSFLIWRAALAAATVLIVAATFVCIVLYKMPIHVKAEIGGGSALTIAGISFLFRLTRKRSKS
jgi:hypothetical protein